MSQALEEAARARISREALAANVAGLTARGEIIAGSAEEEAACAYIVDTLKKAGVAMRVHTLDGYVNYPLKAELSVAFPEPMVMEAVGSSFGVSTPAEGFSGRVVYVGDSTAADYAGLNVAGAIVLLNKLPNPGRAREAVIRGAVGMVCVAERNNIQKLVVNPVWGAPGIDEVGAIPRVPVLTVSRDDGDKLIRMAKSGELRVSMRTENWEGWRTLHLPVAEIPGKNPEFALAAGHYCTWFDGVTDNNTGGSCLMELARVLTAQAKEQGGLKYGVKIAWWPGHSQARYAGSTWFADTFWQELNDRCLGYLNIDSPGVRGASTWRLREQSAELSGFTLACLRESLGWTGAPKRSIPEEPRLRPRPKRNSDQSFLGIGVSSFCALSMLPDDHPDRNPDVSGCGGAWWWHSADDTMDKFDVDVLHADTAVYASLLLRLTDAPQDCYDFSATAVDFTGLLEEYAAAAKGRLDFSRVLDNAATLRKLAGDFAQKPCRDAAEERHKMLLNLKLGRLLTPLFYTATDRFVQHPAIHAPHIPLLARCGVLGAMDSEAGEYPFLHTTLSRVLTKINASFLEAIRLLEASVR